MNSSLMGKTPRKIFSKIWKMRKTYQKKRVKRRMKKMSSWKENKPTVTAFSQLQALVKTYVRKVRTSDERGGG